MAYFAAMLARTDDGWSVSDSDLDEIDDLDRLTESMRKASAEDEPVLLFVEQEDMWFGIVRVDGAEDPRVFVSDPAAASRSSYGAMLLAGLDGPVAGDDDYVEDEEGTPYLGSEPAGDTEILTDLRTPPDELLDLCGEGVLPTEALTAVAERAGFADELESIR